jgi:hypothetical protein
VSIATFLQSFAKYNYDRGQIPRLVNEDHVFLDKLTKIGGGCGSYFDTALLDHNAQGVGPTLAVQQAVAAQASGSNVSGAQWIVPWGDYGHSVYITDKEIAQSASDLGSFFQSKKENLDSQYRNFGDSVEQLLLRDSGHSLGVGAFSAGTITFTNKSDVVNFEVGQILQASANDGSSTGHTLLGSGSLGYVVAVNQNAGTIDVSATSGGTKGVPSSWTGTIYVFRYGEFGGDTAPNQIVDSFGQYIPATDPSDTFRNVDRSINVVARSGVRLLAADCTGLSTEDRIKKIFTRMASMRNTKMSAKDVCLHPIPWQGLANSLEKRGYRILDGKAGIFSFPKLELATAAGNVSIWQNKFMPLDVGFVPDFATCELHYLGTAGFPSVLSGDGLTMLRRYDANTYEHRLVSYPAFVVKAPARNGRFPVQATF